MTSKLDLQALPARSDFFWTMPEQTESEKLRETCCKIKSIVQGMDEVPEAIWDLFGQLPPSHSFIGDPFNGGDILKRSWREFGTKKLSAIASQLTNCLAEQSKKQIGQAIVKELDGSTISKETLASITELDLSNLNLTILPEVIGVLRGLESLNVSDNHLESLPESLGQLPKLQALDLSGNLLTSLPESVRVMKLFWIKI